MELQRLDHKQLIEKGKEIFYDFMVSSEDYFSDGQIEPCTPEYPTITDMLYKEILDSVKENARRIKMYEDAIEENIENQPCVKALKQQLEFLKKEKELFLKSNMKNQKAEYKKQRLQIILVID